MLWALIGCSVLLATLSTALGAPGRVEILFRAGDRAADGTPVGAIDRAVTIGAGGVLFLGRSSAIVAHDGTGRSTLAATGDAVPGSSTVFESFEDPFLSDTGSVAFQATRLGGGVATFLAEGGSLRQIDVARLRVTGMTPGGDLVLRRARTQLFVLRRTAGASLPEEVIDLRGEQSGLIAWPGVVANDAGAIVFRGRGRFLVERSGELRRRRATGVFLVPAGDMVQTLALEGAAAPVAGAVFARVPTEPTFSINARGDVALAAPVLIGKRRGAVILLYEAGTATARVVAAPGHAVGGDRLARVSADYAGVDDHGHVAFVGCVTAGWCGLLLAGGGKTTVLTVGPSGLGLFGRRLDEAHHVAWAHELVLERFDGEVDRLIGPRDATPIGRRVTPGRPSVNRFGAVAFRTSRDVLYRLQGTAARPAISSGDRLSSGRALLEIRAYASDRVVAVVGRTTKGFVVAAGNTRRLVPLVVDGQAAPEGGTFEDVENASVAVTDAAVYLKTATTRAGEEGCFRAPLRGGRVSAVLVPGQRGPRPDIQVGSCTGLSARGATAVMGARLRDADGDEHSAVFAHRNGRLRVIALAGDGLPREEGPVATSLGPAVTDGRRVVLAANQGELGAGLFSWAGDEIRAVARGGAAVRPTGMLDGHFGPLALAREVVCLARVDGRDAVVGIRDGEPRVLAVSGDEALPGLAAEFFLEGEAGWSPLALVPGAVILTGAVRAENRTLSAILSVGR